MKIKNGYVLREIAGAYVVVATGERAIEFNGMINLNETGSVLWERASETFEEQDLIDALMEKYLVSKEQASSDVDKFIDILKENDFLE